MVGSATKLETLRASQLHIVMMAGGAFTALAGVGLVGDGKAVGASVMALACALCAFVWYRVRVVLSASEVVVVNLAITHTFAIDSPAFELAVEGHRLRVADGSRAVYAWAVDLGHDFSWFPGDARRRVEEFVGAAGRAQSAIARHRESED